MPDRTALVAAAGAAARRAAQYIRSARRPAGQLGWERKGLLDYVTEVDRTAERLIAEELLRAVPGSRILGEELSPGLDLAAPAARDGLLWVVDPLDGTTNYLHDYPQYAVSIAALADGALVAAVVLDIARDLLYHATAGGGAFCQEQRLAVSPVTRPDLALIGTGFPFRTPALLPRYLRQFAAIALAASGIRRAGSAALDLADVARGRFEGFWELDLAPWDVAAGTLLVREAGGLVTDLAGSPDVIRQGPKVAGNPAIHAWLLEVLNP